MDRLGSPMVARNWESAAGRTAIVHFSGLVFHQGFDIAGHDSLQSRRTPEISTSSKIERNFGFKRMWKDFSARPG